MIEQRSIVLTALILAIVLAGGSFYFFVLKPQVEPSELATRSVGQLALEGNKEKEGVVSEVPFETPVEATVGAAGEIPTPLPAPEVAGAEGEEDVAPTAKTGAGSLLALGAAFAVIVGSWELVLMIRSHGPAPKK